MKRSSQVFWHTESLVYRGLIIFDGPRARIETISVHEYTPGIPVRDPIWVPANRWKFDQNGASPKPSRFEQWSVTPGGCCGDAPPIVTWIWIRWYGTPKPIRWLMWIAGTRRSWSTGEGCGCPIKTKAGWLILKTAWKQWIAA